MHRITATRRNQAFQALTSAAAAIRNHRAAETPEWRGFWADVARDSIMAARFLRLRRVEYPSIPA
jgi:hypothetical protein